MTFSFLITLFLIFIDSKVRGGHMPAMATWTHLMWYSSYYLWNISLVKALLYLQSQLKSLLRKTSSALLESPFEYGMELIRNPCHSYVGMNLDNCWFIPVILAYKPAAAENWSYRPYVFLNRYLKNKELETSNRLTDPGPQWA